MNRFVLSVRTFVCLLAFSLSACSNLNIPFISNEPDYKSAGRSRPLEVPPDLTSVSSSDTYSVPGAATTYSGFNQEQGADVREKILPTSDSVRLERAGSQRWLVVDAPAEKIWPVVREFWTDLGFAVRLENPETGVMETTWENTEGLTPKAKGTYLEKFDSYLDKLSNIQHKQQFRTRLDRDSEHGTTEIYLSHRSASTAPDDGKARIQTPYGQVETGYRLDKDKKAKTADERAIEEDIDAELLRRLMVKLGVEEQRSRTIMASPVTEKRATLSKEGDGTLNLELTDQFDRAWRRVGLALDRIGFVVEDKDRSNGVFYVRYTDVDIDDTPEKKKGLFDKLKFWGDDDKKTPEPEPKKDDKGLVDKLKFWNGSDKEKVDPSKQYRVKVASTDSGSQVTINDKDGRRNRSTTANRITNLLYEQLK